MTANGPSLQPMPAEDPYHRRTNDDADGRLAGFVLQKDVRTPDVRLRCKATSEDEQREAGSHRLRRSK